MSDVRTAPGFNNALACMTIAVGAGAMRAGFSGSRSAQASIGQPHFSYFSTLT